MTRHLLMDPAFPDMIVEWAASEPRDARECANDNVDELFSEVSDPLLLAFARLEIAATRLW
jgi:hypothetical protein